MFAWGLNAFSVCVYVCIWATRDEKKARHAELVECGILDKLRIVCQKNGKRGFLLIFLISKAICCNGRRGE